jgi:hypothetical protein
MEWTKEARIMSIETARAEAEALGIKVHHRANEDTINKAIESHRAASIDPELSTTAPAVTVTAPKFGRGKVMTESEWKKEEVGRRKRNVGALRRISVTCMNPQKADWDGEMFFVGSAKLGSYRKFVPFNGKPWHVPQMIYDMIRERKCTIFQSVRERGQTFKKPMIINEFAIQDLPPLTQKELEDLAHQQALADHGL